MRQRGYASFATWVHTCDLDSSVVTVAIELFPAGAASAVDSGVQLQLNWAIKAYPTDRIVRRAYRHQASSYDFLVADNCTAVAGGADLWRA